MFDEIDDLRVNLREAADGFRPSLDAERLATAGRRVQRRNRVISAVVGVAALGVVAGFGLPVLLHSGQGIPAAPAPVEGPEPSRAPAPEATTESGQSTFEVDMSGWLTFASPEYPVTFQYPPDWTVDDDLYGDGKLGKTDGCSTVNCVLFVNPPDPESAAPLELIRSGFDSSDSMGGGIDDGAAVENVVTVPDLLVWSSDRASTLSQAVILSWQGASDGTLDYMLGAADPSFTNHLAVGDPNPRKEHPEARFLFTTNVGNIGGGYDQEGLGQVLMILASTRPNPDFDPTRPVEDAAGDQVIEAFDAMALPDLTVSSRSWKSLEVAEANLSVRIPPKWTVVDNGDGVLWIKAPSGYIVDLLTNGMAESCDAGPLPGSEHLGVVDGLEAVAPGAAGTPEIRWVNGGEYPVWIGLALRPDKPCYQHYLDYGGSKPVYLGSADNSANPTAKELDQAVAILASARRLN